MTFVKVQSGGLLAVPDEARRQLGLKDGDYLDLKVEDGALVLRPLSPEEARRRLREIVERDKWIGPGPRPSPEEEERWIFEVLAEQDEKEHA